MRYTRVYPFTIKIASVCICGKMWNDFTFKKETRSAFWCSFITTCILRKQDVSLSSIVLVLNTAIILTFVFVLEWLLECMVWKTKIIRNDFYFTPLISEFCKCLQKQNRFVRVWSRLPVFNKLIKIIQKMKF